MTRRVLLRTLLCALLIAPVAGRCQTPPADGAVLTAAQASAILPATVFFRGQSASIQARNSSGVRFSKDALLLTALVDTSGYSSAIQQTYQAYLIIEAPIELAGHRVVPGAYGFGFLADNKFILLDIGGHPLFTAESHPDAALHRPMPLQIFAQSAGSRRYKLYSGRNFVEFAMTQ